MKLKPISKQVVVLFGATSGLGLETALHMVEKEATVAIIGRNQEGLNEAVERVRTHAEASRQARGRSNGNRYEVYAGSSGMVSAESGGAPVTEMEEQVIGLEADVTNWEQVRSAADQVVERFGRIDTWINLAAVSEWSLFEDMNAEEFRRIIDVNLVGQANGALAALPHLKAQQSGTLIFVSSVAGRVPLPYQAAYNASKHGVLALAETLRMELRHTGNAINVAAILPSSMNTPLFNKARTKMGVEPEPYPPIYDTKLVARAITHAAQHPVRELIVGDAGYIVTFMRRLAPTLTNRYMGSTGFRQQRSNEAKSAQAPDNLYHHLEGYNQVEGEFAPRTMRFSPITWLATHPKVRLGLMSALIAGTGFWIGSRIIESRSQRRRGFGYQAKKFGNEAVAFLASLPLISSLPMFRHRSLGERIMDALPFDRSKSMRDRLPDMPSPRRVSSKITDRGKTAASRLTDRTSSTAERISERGKEAAEKVSKSSKRAARQVSKSSRKAADKISDKMSDLENTRGARLHVKAEVSGERIRNRHE